MVAIRFTGGNRSSLLIDIIARVNVYPYPLASLAMLQILPYWNTLLHRPTKNWAGAGLYAVRLSAIISWRCKVFQYSMLFSLSPVLSPPLRRLNVLDCISAYLLHDHQTFSCLHGLTDHAHSIRASARQHYHIRTHYLGTTGQAHPWNLWILSGLSVF